MAPALRLAHLFNHLVGMGEQCWRDIEPGRLRSLEVDYWLELCGLFDGKVCGAFSSENATKVRRSAAPFNANSAGGMAEFQRSATRAVLGNASPSLNRGRIAPFSVLKQRVTRFH